MISIKIISIHQPNFIPAISYFDKMRKSDALVLLDDVKFSRQSFTNRNRIKSNKGPMWLTVPIKKRRHKQLISDLQIDYSIRWREKHLGTIMAYYAHSPFIKNYLEMLKNVYSMSFNTLFSLNSKLLSIIKDEFGINTSLLVSSELGIPKTLKTTSKIIVICKSLNADVYLSGVGGSKTYLDRDKFKKNGMRLIFNEFDHPVYTQQYPELGFIKNLSIIDYLLNEGPKPWWT